MLDIGSGELVVIGVVALIAIGPKELPGVLRMVGQWVGKARRMAGEFQAQFHEAMREAEMADLKKSFDEVSEAARGASPAALMTSTAKDLEDSLKNSVAIAPPPAPETNPTPIEPHPAEIHSAEIHPAEIHPAEIHPAEIPPPPVPGESVEGKTGS